MLNVLILIHLGNSLKQFNAPIKKLNLPCLDHRFFYGVFFKIILFSLTPSQIWLSPLVDDCQFAYITKLNKNKSKTKLGTQTRFKSMKIEGKKRWLKNKKDSTRGSKEMKIHDCPKQNTTPGSIRK
jgi:hypothetical protein